MKARLFPSRRRPTETAQGDLTGHAGLRVHLSDHAGFVRLMTTGAPRWASDA